MIKKITQRSVQNLIDSESSIDAELTRMQPPAVDDKAL